MSSSPGGMALDLTGGVLVADNNNHRVVRIAPDTGALTTIAGTGVAGFSGDGGPAAQAQLSTPFGVAVDASGNIFIADSGNYRVRRIDAQTGIITTIAGTGAVASTGDGGPAINAAINGPMGLAFDSAGNLFVADSHGNYIRRIDAISATITSVAGNGVAAFTPDGAPAVSSSIAFPAFLAFDRGGNLLVSEYRSQRVRRIDSAGLLSTVAGNGTSTYGTDGGLAIDAAIGSPGQLALDAAGNLYIPSLNLGRVFRVDAASGLLYTIAGNGNTSVGASSGDGGLATAAVIPQPISTLVMPNGDLMVVDGWAYSVRRISLPSPLIYTAVSIFESVAGREVTVRVAPVNGSGVPTGVVQFSTGYGAPVSATALLSNGVATYMETGASSIMATYLGDATYSPATSPGLPLPSRIPTSIALASSTNPSLTQQPVTFTVTITTGGGSSYLPTGTVQLLDGNTVIASTTTLNGTAQFTTSFSSAGSHSMTAFYQGDSTYAGGVSQVLTQTVSVPQVTVALASSAPNSTYGQAVQFTATLSDASATGTVQFLDGGATLGSAPVAGGAAVLSAASMNAGAHSIVASYSGDASHSPATSAPLAQNVVQATPTFTLTSSANPSVVGDTVTFSATMSPVSTGASFSIQVSNPPPSMQGSWSTTGQTSATTSTLAAGAHTVTAVWAGDANVAAGTSAQITQIVKTQASGVVTSSANPATAGSPLTFTVAVSPATATGSVEFRDYGTSATAYTTLGSAALSGGSAALTTSALAIGSHNIAVNYAGDANNAGFTSPVIVQVVNAIATTVTLTSAENPTYPQHPVSFSVTVTPSGNPTAQPSGTVQVFDGTTLLATVSLQNGASAFPLSFGFGTHSLTAVYSGDSTFAGGTSAALAEVVKNSAGGNVSSSGFLPVGQAVTFTATILPSDATGTVEFRDYGSAGSTYAVLATAPLSGGIASFTTSSLAVGTHNIVGHYSGDASYLSFDTPPLGQVVTKLAANLSPSSSENPTVPDRAITISVTVTPSMPFATAATGAVQLLDAGAPIASATLENSSAQFSVSFSTVGPHALTVSYGGDANYLSNTSGTLTESVNKLATATALASSPNPSTAGQTVTLTTTVSPAAATGTVQFLDGATALGTVALNGGTASLAVPLPAGSHSITAAYSGDSTRAASSSAAVVQTVNKIATTVTISSSPNPSVFGQAVTLTATVSPAAATGTVQFLDADVPLGTVTVSGGIATLATTALRAGSHALSAVYSGDSAYLSAFSATLPQTVNRAATSVSLSSSANPANFGQTVTFTAVVAPASATGSVQFLDGGAVLGTAPVSSGVAVMTTSSLGAGTHSISAAYSGDANYVGASASLSQSIKPATTTTLSSSAASITYGQTITFTATVSPSAATGSAQFFDGAISLGVAPVSNGRAKLSLATLSAGAHSITAVYSGDAVYSPSASAASLVTVAQAKPSISLSASPNPAAAGQAVTLTAKLPAAATGTVEFDDGAVVLGTASVNNGVATFVIATLASGTHPVTASYSGDANFTPTTSNKVNLKVN